MSASPPAPPLQEELRQRWCTHWMFKMVGTTAFMSVFFAGYFATLKSPLFPVTTIPLTAVDRWVAFRPESILLYVSLWIYVALPPALLRQKRELVGYGLAAAVLGTAGLGIFLFYPTTILRPNIDWTQYPAFAFLQEIDAAGNACPSLHVAFAVFSAFALDRVLRKAGGGRVLRFVNVAWCVGILYSTLATKQHVAIDLAAGTVLGFAAVALHRRIEQLPVFTGKTRPAGASCTRAA
ncbi:MAG TPA: phosphatase PAP2 family protein [Opitutaceae bacterium]